MAVRKPPYSSAFAGDISAYIDMKDDLGFECTTRKYVLYDFDKWCAANGAEAMDAATVGAWVEDRRSRVSSHYCTWISVIRDFGRFMRAVGHEDACVLSRDYQSGSTRQTPYLLSQGEADAFFAEAARAKLAGPMGWQAVCVFGLMYACGLRPGEARALRRHDIRPGELEIDVVESKGKRSRRLAVTDEVMEMIEKSDSMTSAAVGEDRRLLFVSSSGDMLTPKIVSAAFRRIWRAAGLPESQHGRKPTCYLLRHHFAYANVERWAAEGLDPNAMLPYLQRYMGHASVNSTLYYIHTSPDFMAGFADVVSGLDGLLPEVGFDG